MVNPDDVYRGLRALYDPSNRHGRDLPAEDGEVLAFLVELIGAKHVVETGTYRGCGALWISSALLRTGGHLHTIEIDTGFANSARANLKRAGVESLVTVTNGDAAVRLPEIPGPIDLLFLDARKQDYATHLALVVGKIRPGGLIVAHDTVKFADAMGDYLEAIRDPMRYATAVITGPAFKVGLHVTMKRES